MVKARKSHNYNNKVCNNCFAYGGYLQSNNQGAGFALGKYLFGAHSSITKNADPEKYNYSGYGTGCDIRGSFLLSESSRFGKNGLVFGAHLSSLVHTDNKKKEILTHGKCLTDGLDDT